MHLGTASARGLQCFVGRTKLRWTLSGSAVEEEQAVLGAISCEEPSAVLLNQTEVANHWLQVQLVVTSSERDAVDVEVVLVGSETTQHAWRVAGNGCSRSNEGVVAFGLGGDAMIERLIVSWPDGAKQEMTDITADQRVIVVQGQSGFSTVSELSGQR